MSEPCSVMFYLASFFNLLQIQAYIKDICLLGVEGCLTHDVRKDFIISTGMEDLPIQCANVK